MIRLKDTRKHSLPKVRPSSQASLGIRFSSHPKAIIPSFKSSSARNQPLPRLHFHSQATYKRATRPPKRFVCHSGQTDSTLRFIPKVHKDAHYHLSKRFMVANSVQPTRPFQATPLTYQAKALFCSEMPESEEAKALHSKFGFNGALAGMVIPQKTELVAPEFKKQQESPKPRKLASTERAKPNMPKKDFSFGDAGLKMDLDTIADSKEAVEESYDDAELSQDYFKEEAAKSTTAIEKELMYQMLFHIAHNQLDVAVKDLETNSHANVLHWTALLDGYRKAKRPGEGLKLYDKMIKLGLKPNVVTYGTLMYLMLEHDLASSTEKITQVWEEMLEKGVSPNTAVCSAAIFAHTQTGNFHKALLVYRFMDDNNIRIDPRTYWSLFSKLGHLLRPDQLDNLWLRVQKESVPLGPLAFNCLIFAFAKSKRFKTAFNVKEYMDKHKIPTGFTGYKGLMVASSKSAAWNQKSFKTLIAAMNEEWGHLEKTDPVQAKKLFPHQREYADVVVHNILLTGLPFPSFTEYDFTLFHVLFMILFCDCIVSLKFTRYNTTCYVLLF